MTGVEAAREERRVLGLVLLDRLGWGWFVLALLVVLWSAGIGWFLSLSATLFILLVAGFVIYDRYMDGQERKAEAERLAGPRRVRY